MNYFHEYAICPYWIWCNFQKIGCEAGTIKFPDKSACRDYLKSYCGSIENWGSCTIAKSLTDYHERICDEQNRKSPADGKIGKKGI